jgi:hypothetical protein
MPRNESKEIIHYTDNDGHQMVVTGNGTFTITAPAEMLEKIETILQSVEASVGRRFNPKQPTVGSLVGVPLGRSEETAEAAASVNANENSSAHFDPMQCTVGDLTGLKTVPQHISHRGSTYGGIGVVPFTLALHPRKEVSR